MITQTLTPRPHTQRRTAHTLTAHGKQNNRPQPVIFRIDTEDVSAMTDAITALKSGRCSVNDIMQVDDISDIFYCPSNIISLLESCIDDVRGLYKQHELID